MSVLDNWIDIAIVVIVAWNIVAGVRRGAIPSLVDLVSFVVASLAALWFSVTLADWVMGQWPVPPLSSRPLAFAALWITANFLVRSAGRRLGATLNTQLQGTVLDWVLSVLPSAVKGFVIAALLLTLVRAIPRVVASGPGSELLTNLQESVAQSLLAGPVVERTATLDRYVRELVGAPPSPTILTIRPEEGERVELGFRAINPIIDAGVEARMLDLLNVERVSAGLQPLVRDERLERTARAHSVEMVQQGYLAHENAAGWSPFDRIHNNAVRFTLAGENLAFAPTVEVAHQELMKSPGHRANILRPEFGRVGIGVALAEGRGLMFTQNFAN